jgi:hypothetical protein
MSGLQARTVAEARMLVSRLARLSADSSWARRASGHRGALLRYLECADVGNLQLGDLNRLEQLVTLGHEILVHAAREIIAPEEITCDD